MASRPVAANRTCKDSFPVAPAMSRGTVKDRLTVPSWDFQQVLTQAGRIRHSVAEFAKYEEMRRQIEAETAISESGKAVADVKRLGRSTRAADPK